MYLLDVNCDLLDLEGSEYVNCVVTQLTYNKIKTIQSHAFNTRQTLIYVETH